MVGIDIVQISRIKLSDSFVQMILTDDELTAYQTRTNDNARKEYLAERFAAKEAIFKATQDPDYLKYSIFKGRFQ